MKSFILVVFLFLMPVSVVLSQHAPVYLTLVSHTEDNSPWTTYNYYKTKRDLFVQIANIVHSKGAVWSFQNDWKFLQGVMMFDTGSVVSNTNGKNLIKWMTEDMGIFCDPHSHEANGYNYADVAYLHQQLGIIPTKIVGGFLYDTVINGNNWENFEAGQYGRMYPSYFWQPDVLWGSGTRNHFNDPYPLGAWKPKSMDEYYVHDTTKHMVVIGHGCENHIEDTSNITYNTAVVRNYVEAITTGGLPDSGFYPAFSIFNGGDLTTTRITKITQFIDSVASMVSSGRVQWKSLTEVYNIWNASYGKKPYWVLCENIPLAVQQVGGNAPVNYSLHQNYPNPFNPVTNITFEIPERSYAELKVFDITGRLVEILLSNDVTAGVYKAEWNAAAYSSGVYFYSLITRNFTYTRKLILIK